jgi:cell division protein FtsN
VKAEAPPVAKPAPAKIEPVKPPKTETPPKSVAALIQQANSDPAKPAPAAKTPPPAAKPAAAPAAQATGAPRSLTPPQQTAAAATAPAKLAAPAPAPGGSYMLQIGAFKSQAEAAAAWKSYQAKHAALLSGYSDNVQQADLGEKGTWYRLRIGGLADKEVATALCDRLKADGGACMLGR